MSTMQFFSVSYEEVCKYAEEERLIFREMSAKSGLNVNEVFYDIAKLLSRKVLMFI